MNAGDPGDHGADWGGRVHLVGIGGAGMSGIARILLDQGVAVSGSDAKASRRIDALRALGAHIAIGHEASALDLGDGVLGGLVVSTAVPEDNPEVGAARDRGLPVWGRAQALARVMRGRRAIAIAGTHGKTTTTSMVTVALQAAGADPSFVIGSELQTSGANAHLGSGVDFVVEADESDGSFLELEPVVSVVTNVEADHLDHWSDLDEIDAAFARFTEGTAARGGFTLVCADDPGGRRLAESGRASGWDVRTYGQAPDADFRIGRWSGPGPGRTGGAGGTGGAAGAGWTFEIVHRGIRLDPVSLQVPGRHNALNATAALAVGLSLGYPEAALREGLASFTGSRRRFELRGRIDGVRVFDDYAHHPTEVLATLRAAREVAGDGRVVVAFQSHRYSRTAAFAEEFGRALADADEVIVLEVYPAGEAAIPGASGSVVAAAAVREIVARGRGGDSVVFEPSWSAVPERVAERVRDGDVVLTMGAGDVGMLVPDILAAIQAGLRP